MKKQYLLLITCFITANIFCQTKSKKSISHQTPWYHSYRKAAFTGSLIGALMVPVKPFGYGLVMTATGEGTLKEVLTKFAPHIRKSLIVSAGSGVIAACFVVAVLKALDLGKRERKKQLEKLYKEIHDIAL